MAKASKTRNSNSNSSGSGSSGLLSSILGMFNFGNINVCTANDQGLYCSFMRFFQLFIAVLIFLVIIYVLYKLFFSYSGGKSYGGKLRK